MLMSPLMNDILVIAAVTAAVVYFVWHSLGRKRKSGPGCGGDCGCASEQKPQPPAQAAANIRK